MHKTCDNCHPTAITHTICASLLRLRYTAKNPRINRTPDFKVEKSQFSNVKTRKCAVYFRLDTVTMYLHFRLALAHVSSMSKKEGPCMQTVHLCLAAGQRCDSDTNCNLAPTPRYSPSNMDQAGTCARSRQKTYTL